MYLLDGIITLPLLCWLCIADKKKALLTAASLFCLVIITGSFIIPDENQTV
ncbi:hypothetical protein [Halioxenophilus aromaticivorans]|uniref:Uncharacterized protein n=1 Tax=Halioxenophilus aromaticivorans TaxID=1306992 RepID=A0AAV3U7W3_9ALTE